MFLSTAEAGILLLCKSDCFNIEDVGIYQNPLFVFSWCHWNFNIWRKLSAVNFS